MKRPTILFLLFCFLCTFPAVRAADTIFVRETQIPVLIERIDNVLFYLRLDATESKALDEVTLEFANGSDLSAIQSVKLYYSQSFLFYKESGNV